MTYDWQTDAKKSWELAISEKRKAGLLSGKYQPRNDEERAIVGVPASRHWAKWTDENIVLLKQLATQGISASEIAVRFKVTRSAVLGKLHRLGIVKAMPLNRKSPMPRQRPQTPGIAPLAAQSPAPVLRSPKPRKAIPEPPKPQRGPFHILDLGAGQCRFATGHRMGVHLFCGAECGTGSSWCPEHSARVFQPLTTKRPQAGSP